MEFLVNIRFPDSADRLSPEDREELVVVERRRAAELAEEGKLIRMWRVPGRRENWGLWRADDASDLHQTLTSLPFWPYMDLDVYPLAKHPVDPLAPNEGL